MSSREYVTLAEFAERVGKPLGSLYHQSRRDAIPGLVRVSPRSIRIHWPSYQAAVLHQKAPAV